MAFRYSPKLVTNGLVFAIDFANPNSYISGSTVCNDLTSGIVKGVVYNSPTFDSGNAGTLLFNGTSSYIDFGTAPANSVRGGSQFTFGYWVKKVASNKDAMAGSWNQTTRQGFFLEWFTDNNIYFGNSAGAVNNNVAALTWTNEWYYIVGVFDGSQSTNATKGKIYVNGQLLNQGSSTLNTTTVSNTLSKMYVGFVENYSLYTNAYMTGVSLYNRALSSDEVLQNYNTLKSRFGK
jgi:hypothetical protein